MSAAPNAAPDGELGEVPGADPASNGAEQVRTLAEEQPASLPRAAKRIDWAARALAAAAFDLQEIGAPGAGNVIADEACRLEALAGEVREMRRRREAA